MLQMLKMLERFPIGDASQGYGFGELKTVNGDITVGADSRVGGGILVEKPHGWSHGSNKTIPKIVIGPRAVVEGTLRFEREVKLYVSRSATIGKVDGATAIMFDGEAP